MNNFYQKFKNSIDATDGTVVINSSVFKEIQLDAFNAGQQKAKLESMEIFMNSPNNQDSDPLMIFQRIIKSINNIQPITIDDL